MKVLMVIILNMKDYERYIFPKYFIGRIPYENETILLGYSWKIKKNIIFMVNIFDIRIEFWILQKW